VPVRRIDRRRPDAYEDAVVGNLRFIDLPQMKDVGGSRTSWTTAFIAARIYHVETPSADVHRPPEPRWD
jgi:hypothetical protein